MRLLPVILMMALFLGAYFYTFYRVWMMMPPTVAGRVFLVIFAILAMAAPFVALALGSKMPDSVTGFLYKFGTSWLIIFLYLLIILLVADLIRVTHLLPIGKYMYNSITGLIGLALITTLIIGSGYLTYQKKKRVELDLRSEKLASNSRESGHGELKAIFVSDLHLGFAIGKKELDRWIGMINAEEPDVVLIGGDLIDNNVDILFKKNFAGSFKNLKTKWGVYAVPGNHEYISGIEKSEDFYKQAGITLLKDSTILIDNSIYITGRDDRTNPERRELVELISGIDKNKPLILLDHQPLHLEEAEKNGIDIQLSGHTHKGQVWPISLITNLLFEKSYGEYQKGDTRYYISSGLGIWGGKFRIGTRSEYVVLRISAK